jgi:uncharacterized membrane protein YhfC
MAFGVQLPLMLLMPILVGVWIAKRFGASWRLWAMGAITFVLSQVVHVPLEYGVWGFAPDLRAQPLPLVALITGLSAGLCEEVARYVMLRYGMPKARSFGDAVMFGAGHGGIEAMFIGLLAVAEFAAMFAQRWLPPGSLSPELTKFASSQDAYWSYAWYMPALSGLERISAMIAHVAMTLMVMRAVVRGRIGWLLAAIGVHATVDGFAVWGMTNLGALGTEVGVAVFGALLAGVIASEARSARATRTTTA